MPDDIRIPFQSVLTVRTSDGQEVPIPAIKGEKGDKGDPGESILIDQHTETGLRFWTGTRAQYEAIPESQLIPNCMYWITDDTRDDWYTRLASLEETVAGYDSTIAHLETLVETLEPQVVELQQLSGQIATNTTDITNLKVAVNSLGTTVNTKHRSEIMNLRAAIFAAWHFGFSRGVYKRIPLYKDYTYPNSISMFVPGILGADKTKVYFTVPVAYDLSGLTTAITSSDPVMCNANIYCEGHYININDAYVEYGQDLNLLGSLYVRVVDNHTVTVELTLRDSLASRVANLTNNTPLVVQIFTLACRMRCYNMPYNSIL